MRQHSTKIRIIVATSAAALCIATGASAFFQASGAGAATAVAASLGAPSEVTASAAGVGAVAVSWTGATPPGGGAVTGYYVQRFTGATPAPACGSSPTSLLPPSAAGCTDTGNPSAAGVPAGTYTYEVVAVWRSWSTSSGASDAVTVAGPSVTATSPASADQGATGYTVTVTGANFISGATVAFSGSGITVNSTSFVSATQLTASITVAGTAATGARDITVTNPDGDAATATGAFTVAAAPTVTAATPSTRGQGTSNQAITITGTGFIDGASLAAAFSGSGITVNSISYTSPTQLSANVTVSGTAAPGARNVTITNGDGSSATGTGVFTVDAAPTVTSVTGSSADQGATGYAVTITGTNFAAGATASFSGSGITVNSISFVSPTQLTANVTVSGTAAPGARNVTVTNTDLGAGTGTGVFTVNSAPTVGSLGPAAGDRGATNETVTITGTNFISGATVVFSGTGVTATTTYVSPTQLTASVTITTAAATGARNVTVTNGDGSTASKTSAFTVNAAPTVTSATPAELTQGQSGQTIAIAGSGFESGAAVSFSGSGITATTSYNSATSLTATVTTSASATTGPIAITVTNPDNSAATCTGCTHVFGFTDVAQGSATSGKSLTTSTTFTLTSADTYLVLVSSKSSSGDSAAIASSSFSPTPTLNPVGGEETYGGSASHNWAWSLTGGSGTGKVTVTLSKGTSQAYIDVIAIAGASTSSPFVTGTLGTAMNGGSASSTTASGTATAALTGAPAAGDAELAFFSTGGTTGAAAPASSLAQITAVSGSYHTGTGGSAGAYAGAATTSTDSLTLGTAQYWGTVAIELTHS